MTLPSPAAQLSSCRSDASNRLGGKKGGVGAPLCCPPFAVQDPLARSSQKLGAAPIPACPAPGWGVGEFGVWRVPGELCWSPSPLGDDAKGSFQKKKKR